MALSMTTTTVYGLTATDAYHRVEHVVIASKSQIEFTIMAYAAAEHPMAFGAKTMRCAYDINGENPIRQAYLYLKTLPEFANAVDC